MRRDCIALAAWLVLWGLVLSFEPRTARAQGEASSENLLIIAGRATTWVDAQNPAINVVQLEGGATLDLDRTRMSADRVVIWLTPARRPVLDELEAHIALVDNAVIDQPGQFQRSGDRLMVTGNVRGTIRITARERKVGNLDHTELYKVASTLRPLPPGADNGQLDWMLPAPAVTTQPATQPAKRRQPVAFSADRVETIYTAEGTVAMVVTGNVKLFQRRGEAELIELQADRTVLFTPLKDLRELDKSSTFTKVEDAIVAAYLEGDVRIVRTPVTGKRVFDQRLTAERCYYDFETDRAVLTDAVIHTVEPRKGIPVVVRAQIVRQLSQNEFRAESVKLSQSSFFKPSYHIGLKQAYIRQYDTGEHRYGTATTFTGKEVTFNAYGVPYFYMPHAAATFTERGGVLRNISISNDNRFGFGLETRLGLFETLGKLPPRDLDAELALDYFTDRGPATGLNAMYGGGRVTEGTRQPWNFQGRLESYAVYDHGEDNLGRRRLRVEPDQEFRYRVLWEHQHFFPDNWQVQVSGAIMSDPSFQEQWFRDDFWVQRPQDTAIYLKRQKETEAFALLYSFQPNDFVTTSELYQEQTEVERVPEIAYRRIGDSLAGDTFTFFSHNTIGGYRFQRSRADLSNDLGFSIVDSPGLPAFGRTGTPSRITWRGDFRQEIDYPFTLGQFRVVPYVMGRYTTYSRSPEDSANDRLMVGAGMRVTTAFWKVDDTVKSELWDLHRLRHVIEPELNLFTSAQSIDRNRVFQYDESIDEISDISAVHVALRQRWQTKRGGAGRWRSVDFFTLNVEGNFFFNKPEDSELAPTAFRGLYFASEPEFSVPRNGINADATWRISDTTAILADAQYNLDDSNLATGSIGLVGNRNTRLSYFLGCRYINSQNYLAPLPNNTLRDRELHSVLVTGAMTYEIAPQYTFGIRQSFDFGVRESVLSYYSITRHFDRWYAAITFRVDYVGDASGIFFNLWPEGLGVVGGGSERLQSVFR